MQPSERESDDDTRVAPSENLDNNLTTGVQSPTPTQAVSLPILDSLSSVPNLIEIPGHDGNPTRVSNVHGVDSPPKGSQSSEAITGAKSSATESREVSPGNIETPPPPPTTEPPKRRSNRLTGLEKADDNARAKSVATERKKPVSEKKQSKVTGQRQTRSVVPSSPSALREALPEWITLEEPLNSDGSMMDDQLISSPPLHIKSKMPQNTQVSHRIDTSTPRSNVQGPLFLPSDSQTPFAFSQWPEVNRTSPEIPSAIPLRQENGAAVEPEAIERVSQEAPINKARQDEPASTTDSEDDEPPPITKPVRPTPSRWKSMMDIASQTIFPSQSLLQPSVAKVKASTAKDESESEEESSSEDENSHIPAGRRAGPVTRSRK